MLIPLSLYFVLPGACLTFETTIPNKVELPVIPLCAREMSLGNCTKGQVLDSFQEYLKAGS